MSGRKCKDKKTKRQEDKETKIQKYKNTKTQKHTKKDKNVKRQNYEITKYDLRAVLQSSTILCVRKAWKCC